MPEWDGFWSYVHADDEAEGSRISRLASDLVAQFELLTGERIHLFLDRDAIEWGTRWRDAIDESFSSVAFFIPILTPRYFQSVECRRELNSFARRATGLGVKELVLPLLYVDVLGIHDEASGDELVDLVRSLQWADWRDLRFADSTSEGYRRGVAGLASRLVDANARADDAAVLATASTTTTSDDEDDAPQFIDRLATMEETLPKWTETVKSISTDIELVGSEMQSASSDIERADNLGRGFAGRLSIARRLAAALTPLGDRIWSRANEFAAQLHDVDLGVRTGETPVSSLTQG